MRGYFPGLPCYEHFVALQKSAFVPLVFFLLSHLGTRTGLYYINFTALPVCDNHRINRHKVFAGLAQRGKTSMGWFFGFKLHLVFNTDNEIVALKLTPGNVHDTTPVPALTRDLTGKLFGDKGYIGQKLAEDLLRRGLTLFTRVRKNMKALPISLEDKALLNARNMAETIIGHMKEFYIPQSVQASIRHQRLRPHHRGHHRLPDQPVQAQAQPAVPLSARNHSLKTPYPGYVICRSRSTRLLSVSAIGSSNSYAPFITKSLNSLQQTGQPSAGERQRPAGDRVTGTRTAS